MKAVIIDSDQEGKEFLESTLNSFYPSIKIIATGESLKEAVDFVDRYRFDFMFISTEIPDGTVCEIRRVIGGDIIYIIMMSYDEKQALSAFRFGANDFLLKPVDETALYLSIKKVYSLLNRSGEKHALIEGYTGLKSIPIYTSDSIIIVDLDNIVSITGEGSYSRLYLINGERVLTSKVLKQFEEVLRVNRFLRIHKSHIINLRHLKRVYKNDGFVLMSDGRKIEISNRRKGELMNLLEWGNFYK